MIPTLGSRTIVQIGLIVRDIEATSRAYADLFGMDVPKWFLTDPEEVAQTRYRGKRTQARAKLAFFDMGTPLTWEACSSS
jgi:hypothetical protein